MKATAKLARTLRRKPKVLILERDTTTEEFWSRPIAVSYLMMDEQGVVHEYKSPWTPTSPNPKTSEPNS